MTLDKKVREPSDEESKLLLFEFGQELTEAKTRELFEYVGAQTGGYITIHSERSESISPANPTLALAKRRLSGTIHLTNDDQGRPKKPFVPFFCRHETDKSRVNAIEFLYYPDAIDEQKELMEEFQNLGRQYLARLKDLR